MIFTLSSCNKQKLKLPILHANAINQVYNNSEVWVFFTVKGKDTIAQLNRNNSIETTNWLFNIDRRLSLKQVYKPLKLLLKKRQKKSPHHVEGLKNYFSFADTLNKKVKFLPFILKNIIYKLPTVNDTLAVNFIFNKANFNLNDKTFLYSNLNTVLAQKLVRISNKIQLKFYFNEALSFEKYILIKSKIYNSPNKKQLQSATDYYFN